MEPLSIIPIENIRGTIQALLSQIDGQVQVYQEELPALQELPKGYRRFAMNMIGYTFRFKSHYGTCWRLESAPVEGRAKRKNWKKAEKAAATAA